MKFANNLLINNCICSNSFGSLVQLFFEITSNRVRKSPRRWKGRIFSFLSFFFYPPSIDTTPLQSLVTQQNVPRTDEIHRHFFIFFIIDGGLASKKNFISSVGGVGLSKCKEEINTALIYGFSESRCTSFSGLIRFDYFSPSIPEIITSLICSLLLLAEGWAKAEKMKDHVFGGFFVLCAGVLPLQKFTHLIIILKVFVSSFHSVVHPEGCVLLQLQNEVEGQKI